MTNPQSERPANPEGDHRTEALLSRRMIVKMGLVGVIGAATGLASTAGITRKRRRPRHYRFLTNDEAALLAEICDQLIPADDLPGARETGAVNFIDRQLSGVLATRQPVYRRGLEAFHRTCIQDFKRPFAELPPAVKIEALRAIEAGRVPAELWSNPSAQGFFNLVLTHTMQSFYGSPRHGGNRDYASYRMLGLEYPEVVGQNRYTGK